MKGKEGRGKEEGGEGRRGRGREDVRGLSPSEILNTPLFRTPFINEKRGRLKVRKPHRYIHRESKKSAHQILSIYLPNVE